MKRRSPPGSEAFIAEYKAAGLDLARANTEAVEAQHRLLCAHERCVAAKRRMDEALESYGAAVYAEIAAGTWHQRPKLELIKPLRS